MGKILVVDDDRDLLNFIYDVLITAHEQVTLKNIVTDLTPDEINAHDLMLLDVMMPEEAGFSFLQRHRNAIDIPVLFLTARDFEADRLEGFASGGDDYITKPFSVQELRARIHAHLRREMREKHARLVDGAITCDLIQREFRVSDVVIPLTSSEYEICLYLMKHKPRIFSRESIYTAVYGYDAEGDSQTTVTERIKKIRAKFKEAGVHPIQTVWGIGYKWEQPI